MDASSDRFLLSFAVTKMFWVVIHSIQGVEAVCTDVLMCDKSYVVVILLTTFPFLVLLAWYLVSSAS